MYCNVCGELISDGCNHRQLPFSTEEVLKFIDQINRDDFLAIALAKSFERVWINYPKQFNKGIIKEKIKK